jgi:hypothetical protein
MQTLDLARGGRRGGSGQPLRALYEMKGDDGKRRYTVQQIADRLGVNRATIYRHLDPGKPVSA